MEKYNGRSGIAAPAVVGTLQTPVGKLYAVRSSGEASSSDSSFNGRFQVPYKRTYDDLSVHNSYLAVGRGPGYADRDGVAYEAEEWPRSHTFWQSDQERLLIADKQTRVYTNGGFERRRLLSALAWGQQADPGSRDR